MKIKDFLVKHKFPILVIAIILAGVFLRSIHFSDWAHFELDQSRDARVIDAAIENGPSYLPLLGPRAGGTLLRLGPAFYYMEYFSALIFGDTPAGMARVVWIFAILSLPLFLFFSRFYFSKLVSTLLLAVYSFSLYLIIYSRFAWNPNPLPFFILVILFSLLKVADKQEKKRGLWLVILAIALAISAQLHFLGMLILAMLIVAFLIYSRPKIALKTWILAVFLGLLITSPMIINDIKTHGANVKEFLMAVSNKSEKHSGMITEKFARNYVENAAKYMIIITGKEQTKVLRLKFKDDAYWPNKSNYKDLSRKDIAYQMFGMVLFGFGIFLLFCRTWQEKDPGRKNFLVVFSMFFILCFLVFLPLALFLSPRFFLTAMPLPLILLGLGYDYLLKTIKSKKIGISLVVGITLLLVGMNLVNTYYDLKDTAEASIRPINKDSEMIINERTKFPLEQQYKIDNYIESIYQQNKYPIYIASEAQYQRSILYHLLKAKLPATGLYKVGEGKPLYREGNYFSIYVTGTRTEDDFKSYISYFNIVEEKPFGSMTLFRLVPKEFLITDEKEKVRKGFPKIELSGKDDPNRPKRFLWAEIFLKD